MSTYSVLARIASAVAAVVDDRGQRQVGNMVGHASSTISRWGSDLSAWSAQALILTAAKDASLREELSQALHDLHSIREPASAAAASIRTIAKTTDLDSHLACALADGKIDASEREELRPLVRQAIEQLVRLEESLESDA